MPGAEQMAQHVVDGEAYIAAADSLDAPEGQCSYL
jgi:hypothetical protein